MIPNVLGDDIVRPLGASHPSLRGAILSVGSDADAAQTQGFAERTAQDNGDIGDSHESGRAREPASQDPAAA
jgi:hypothetical protein